MSKSIRTYETSNDDFVCDVLVYPDLSSDNPESWEDYLFPPLRGTDCHIRLSWMLRYPEAVVEQDKENAVCSRLSVISHPNVSPLLVMNEVQHFLSVIQKLLEQ